MWQRRNDVTSQTNNSSSSGAVTNSRQPLARSEGRDSFLLKFCLSLQLFVLNEEAAVVSTPIQFADG